MNEVTCPICKKTYVPALIRRQTDKLIQNEFPDAEPWQREQLVSGICSNECWEKAFA